MKDFLKRVIFHRSPLWVAAQVEQAFGLLGRTWSAYRAHALVPGMGDLSGIHYTTEVKYPENLSIGAGVWIDAFCVLGAASPIVLEDHVRISRGAIIETASLDVNATLPYPHISSPIHICRGAWIGSNAIVLGGVTIGEQAVVGAGAVVTKDVAPRTVVVGTSPRLLSRDSK